MNFVKHVFLKSQILLITMATSIAMAQQKVHAMPRAPSPGDAANGVTVQAGAGSGEAYAEAGVLELGGSASLTVASNFTQFSLAPSIGWFFMDNWQITGYLSWNHAAIENVPSTSSFSLLAEPSFHIPFDNKHFMFFGVGFGLATQTNANVGFAMAPRLNYKTLIGRSGVLTLDIREILSTNDFIETPRGTALTVSSALAIGAGYTVLW